MGGHSPIVYPKGAPWVLQAGLSINDSAWTPHVHISVRGTHFGGHLGTFGDANKPTRPAKGSMHFLRHLESPCPPYHLWHLWACGHVCWPGFCVQHLGHVAPCKWCQPSQTPHTNCPKLQRGSKNLKNLRVSPGQAQERSPSPSNMSSCPYIAHDSSLGQHDINK